MLNQFSRTELIFGKEAMDKLENARVAVFGIRGVGEYTVEALIRSGIGAVNLIDDDKTNINRQIYATRKTVGKYKVDVAAGRIAEINPDAVVTTYKTSVCPLVKVMRYELKRRGIKKLKNFCVFAVCMLPIHSTWENVHVTLRTQATEERTAIFPP